MIKDRSLYLKINNEILDSFIDGVDGFELERNIISVDVCAVVTFLKGVGFADSVETERLK